MVQRSFVPGSGPSANGSVAKVSLLPAPAQQLTSELYNAPMKYFPGANDAAASGSESHCGVLATASSTAVPLAISLPGLALAPSYSTGTTSEPAVFPCSLILSAVTLAVLASVTGCTMAKSLPQPLALNEANGIVQGDSAPARQKLVGPGQKAAGGTSAAESLSISSGRRVGLLSAYLSSLMVATPHSVLLASQHAQHGNNKGQQGTTTTTTTLYNVRVENPAPGPDAWQPAAVHDVQT